LLTGARPRGFIAPAWFGGDLSGVVTTGRALMTAGVHTPEMFPETAVLFDITEETR
jgi:alpha-galactosidase